MADLSASLAIIEQDPDDAQALAALAELVRGAAPEARATRLAVARKALAGRGRPDVVVVLLDVELAVTEDGDRRAALLVEKGEVLEGEVLDVAAARLAFAAALELRKDDRTATEAIEQIALDAEHWAKYAAKYAQEASSSTDRKLATGLYTSAAEQYVRFAPDAPEAETYLRKALEIDPRNSRAAFHLGRLLHRSGRWQDLCALLEERADKATANEDRFAALFQLADVARDRLGDAARAERALKRVLAIDPTHARALRLATDVAAAAGDWPAVIAAYQAALKARREGDDLGMLLQIGMVLWKRLGDGDQAEDYFRRVRKLEPAHPAALDFYRAYYTGKGESGKLIALLKQVDKSPASRAHSEKSIRIEIAELAETQNPEKAIEAWKQHLREDPASKQARSALAQLYKRTEKWNALLDLMKEELERLPESDVEGRVARQFEIAEIYRDRLRLDVMVINTFNAILKIDPYNQRASDELAAKFRALGRWNDLIAILTRKAEAPNLPDAERVKLLRDVADLWADRFGNLANAIKPLERIAEISPADAHAVGKLKEIYTKRRQWRQLIDLLGKEASVLPADDRRAKQAEMARLAAERLGDTRLAIEIHNRVLAEAPSAPDSLAALAGLYEREKRWPALAEILHRQIAVLRTDQRAKEAIALLEKLGQVYAERLAAPQLGAAAFREILDLDHSHAKALRTLRELYAMAGDFAGLEALYSRLGQEDELIDALLAIADRLDSKAARLPLVERAAQLAQKRADAPPVARPASTPAMGVRALTADPGEKARQIWERVLAVEPNHVGAAVALAPVYARQEKWARLIAVLEIELSAIGDAATRIAKIEQIRSLCEHKLASKNLAFTWAVRAFELQPVSDELYAELLRLASEPEQWRELAAAFDRALAAGALPDAVRLRMLRELAAMATRRLSDPERARGYFRQILALVPDDLDAESNLEDLAQAVSDWGDLLGSYRRRAARERDPNAKANLLMATAVLQEQKLVDLDGAAATYREALSVVPDHLKAVRALARIDEARGDWAALAQTLARELALTADPQPKFELVMRIGGIEETRLDAPSRALARYLEAYAIPSAKGEVRTEAVDAVSRVVLTPRLASALERGEMLAATRQLIPHLERAGQRARHAAALEIVRADPATGEAERLSLDRTLMRLYLGELADPAQGWQVGLRVLHAAPGDRDNRTALAKLAGQLGRDGEWAEQLGLALAALQAEPGSGAEVRVAATELAKLAEERLGDASAAERAWSIVLEVEADAPDAFEALAAAYRGASRWKDLRELLERRVEVAVDADVRLRSLLAAAQLDEEVLDAPDMAAHAYRRVLQLDAGNQRAFSALDRLYTGARAWPELEELLGRWTAFAAGDQAVELSYRRAELFARELGDAARAVDLLENVVAQARQHARARELLVELMTAPGAEAVMIRIATVLQPIYEQERLWGDLVALLRAQRAVMTGADAVELLSRVARIEEGELQGARAAFDCWVEILRLDPAHEQARVELVRLAPGLGRWPDATAALEAAAAALDADPAARAAVLGELAAYYDVHAGDRARAIDAYQRLLDVDPSGSGESRRACAALARLFEQGADWRPLRAVCRQLAEWSETPDERGALLVRIAQIEEERLGDRDAAIATWRDVLSERATDASALDALERLYAGTAQWREVIEILRRRVDAAVEVGEATRLLGRIAELSEQKLEEPDEAITTWLEVVDRDSEHTRALDELARLYTQAERWPDLLDVRERQVLLCDGAAQTDLQITVARLLAGPLGRPFEALDRWAIVLRSDPQHPAALAAVEAALDDLDLRVAAADILRPVYAATGQEERTAQLSLKQAEWTDDNATKLRALLDVVRVREQRLSDKAGAFALLLEALRCAVTEPQLADVVAQTGRLAGELGREADLIDVYIQVCPDVLDAEIQRGMYLDIADLARAIRNDHALAREFYLKVLDSTPEDLRALAALEAIYRNDGDNEQLVDVLLRQADVVPDVDEKVGGLVEAAAIYAQLGRSDDATSAWERVLALAPHRMDAIMALDGLYRQQGRWIDVVELYERRLGVVTSIDEAVALRIQLGDIQETQLHDVAAAIESYGAALTGNPNEPTVLAALERYLKDPDARVLAAEVLEPVYVAQQRWQDLLRVYTSKLEGAVEPEERLRLLRFVARLHEEQLEDFEAASNWYARVFREAPGDSTVRDQLQRLASITENWQFVVDAYQGYLDDEVDDSPEVRDVAIAVATIYDRRMNRVELAYPAYRRALGIEPGDAHPLPDTRELLRRTEDMLVRSQRWNELLAIYDDVLGRGDDELRVQALVKRSRLLEQHLQDVERAIDAWREVMLATDRGELPSAEAAYRDAVGELERLYRGRGRWHDLVGLLETRLSRAIDRAAAEEVADLRLRLADVFEHQLNDITASIDQYEEVIVGGTLWERAVAALERLVIHDEHRERITLLLEPIYRQQDWWQKLVVILDAKLEYVREPSVQIPTLHEIAELHERRGGAIDLALAALARAWRLDVADEGSLDRLLALVGRLGAWDEAARALEDGAASADGELAATLWQRAAEIHEKQRKDRARAIDAWRKVDENRSNDPVALAQLDRLLAQAGRVAELVKVIERRAENVEDAGVRLVLHHRVAALYEEVLEDRPRAIASYRNVLSVDDADLTALDALERLYRDTGEFREMAATLERKIELTSDAPQRQELRLMVALVYEQHLEDHYQAIAQLTTMLDEDAGEQRALAELDRIYEKQKMWVELLDVVDRRALVARSQKERADLAFRAARVVEAQLADPDAAIPRLGAVLQIDAHHPEARAALVALMTRDEHLDAASAILERVFRAERDSAGLVRVYERRLAIEGRDSTARRADWEALAEVREQLAGQPTQAFVVWGRAFADAPDDADLLVPLTRLAEAQGLWRELAAVLDERLDASAPTLPPEVEQIYAMRLGSICEVRLNDLERASRAFERASQVGEPAEALAALARVLARADRPAELAQTLRRQADAAAGAQAAELLCQLGELQETKLRSTKQAIAAYRDALQAMPAHGPARAALERLLASSPADAAEIVEILEPLFEADADPARLAMVLEAKLMTLSHPHDQANVLARLVEVSEQQLAEPARALDAALRWLAIDPSSAQVLGEIERLSERLGQWRETASRVDAVVFAKDAAGRAPEVQAALLVFLGTVLRSRLGQHEDAIASYRKALALDPESLAALDPMIELTRERGDWTALADALRTRSRIVQDPAERRAALAEVATLCERTGDTDGALAAWRELADADEADRDALDQLARLYRDLGSDTAALLEVLGRSARNASDPADEKALRIEIAQLEIDGPRAVAAWQAVVDLEPNDPDALSALEAAHARVADWSAVADVQLRRLDLAATSGEKVLIYAEMARLAEARRNSVDDAISAWYSAIEVAPDFVRGYDELERLLAASGRHHDLVELLERRAALHDGAGDTAGTLRALARAADVWEGKLDNPEAAGEILEKILAREPGSVAALTRLSKLYERAGDWDRCKQTLEQALKLGADGRDAADLFFRLGEVARVGDGDDATARQHLEQALRYEPAHPGAIAALEKLARDTGDAALLADMIHRRLPSVVDASLRVTLRLELAELERKADRIDAAVEVLERAGADVPGDVRVLAPLADLYLAAGRLDEAAPIYERLASEAKAARRMKDVARYRQRQGGILEARGDVAGALAAYEESLRVNPTDIYTMLGLGRLYVAESDWEKARKIYQSLVLQTFDADVGVTKGEIYWALGKIHIELGQAPKAKSMFQRGLELEPHNQSLREALAEVS